MENRALTPHSTSLKAGPSAIFDDDLLEGDFVGYAKKQAALKAARDALKTPRGELEGEHWEFEEGIFLESDDDEPKKRDPFRHSYGAQDTPEDIACFEAVHASPSPSESEGVESIHTFVRKRLLDGQGQHSTKRTKRAKRAMGKKGGRGGKKGKGGNGETSGDESEMDSGSEERDMGHLSSAQVFAIADRKFEQQKKRAEALAKQVEELKGGRPKSKKPKSDSKDAAAQKRGERKGGEKGGVEQGRKRQRKRKRVAFEADSRAHTTDDDESAPCPLRRNWASRSATPKSKTNLTPAGKRLPHKLQPEETAAWIGSVEAATTMGAQASQGRAAGMSLVEIAAGLSQSALDLDWMELDKEQMKGLVEFELKDEELGVQGFLSQNGGAKVDGEGREGEAGAKGGVDEVVDLRLDVREDDEEDDGDDEEESSDPSADSTPTESDSELTTHASSESSPSPSADSNSKPNADAVAKTAQRKKEKMRARAEQFLAKKKAAESDIFEMQKRDAVRRRRKERRVEKYHVKEMEIRRLLKLAEEGEEVVEDRLRAALGSLR